MGMSIEGLGLLVLRLKALRFKLTGFLVHRAESLDISNNGESN